ncbi:PKD domain-containing protein [Patulibacter minatonensis]|uniref:PKD domain-containing protein n=1 Tax=Patulibacter minatonensis TaxID=298163 RepID=UPI001B7FECD8|nr:PKD domain-containing protein [Patulibacter minatonensis]
MFTVGVLTLAVPAVSGAAWQPIADNEASAPGGALSVSPSGTLSYAYGFGYDLGSYGARVNPPGLDGRRAPAGVVERRGGAWDATRTPFAPVRLATTSVVHGRSGSAAAWNQDESGTTRVSTRTAGGRWTAWAPVGPDADAPQASTQLLIDHQDRLVAFWRERIPGQSDVQLLTSSRPLSGGAWSAPTSLATINTGGFENADGVNQNGARVFRPQLSADGHVLLEFETQAVSTFIRGGTRIVGSGRLEFRRMDPTGRWGRIQPVAGDEGATLLLEDDGNVVAYGWRADGTSDGAGGTKVRVLPPNTEELGDETSLDTPINRQYAIASLGDGHLLAHRPGRVVPGDYRTNSTIEVRTSADGRSWTAPRAITPPDRSVVQVVTAANRGQGVVTIGFQTIPSWDDQTGVDNRVQAIDWYPWDDSFSQVFTVPDAAKLDSLAIDDRADSVFGVRDATDRKSIVVDDFSGPDITGVSAPKTLKPGATGTFVLKATDQFSALGTVRWDFGDGTIGTGATVKHAFRTTGKRTVSATVTDRWGNATATSTTVRVATGSATAKAAAPVARGPVRVSGIALSRGRLALRSTGKADLLVTIQHRGGSARRPLLTPGPVVRVRTQGAGRVVARVPSLRGGQRFRVRVRADAGSPREVQRLGVNIRVRR